MDARRVLAWLVALLSTGCITVQIPGPRCLPAHTPEEAAAPLPPGPKPAPITLDPSTWHRTGLDPDLYRWSRDMSPLYAGGPSMRFEQLTEGPARIDSWAGTIASIPADAYRGLRVRFRADVRTENAPKGASLWLRLDGPAGPTEICNMIDPVDSRLKGTNQFTPIACILDVPESTTRLVFGLLLSGPGVAWIGPATLEPVDRSIPESPHA